MKRLLVYVLIFSLVAAVVLPAFAQIPNTGVTAEAVGQANLRAWPDVAADLVGEISAGTRYPVIGQAEFFPWLLLADPSNSQPLGWVFRDLVTIQGNVNSIPLSTQEIGAPAAPVVTTPAPDAPVDPLSPSPTPPAPPTPTLAAAVTGTVLGEINIRYGPGTEYPRVGIGRQGDQFEIISWHTQLPWYEVKYAESLGGTAWVASDLLEVAGDVFSLPSITTTNFNLPTLTPTQSVVQAASALGGTPVPLSPAFQVLGDQLWSLMLDAGFETGTSRLGAVFLMDLQTGESVTFGNEIAFSGMSLNKIGILTTLYSVLNSPPDNAEAITIAEAMICSENISTNELLAHIGQGDPFRGATSVTGLLQTVGLQDTFITAPFGNDPFITPQPVSAPNTEADQVSAEPDPFNQATVDELGNLLAGVYQCAYNGTGPLMSAFPDRFTSTECHQILNAMSNNRINALFESGVPLDTRIAHKHGWIDDTHGDAGIIFTPGGDYVLVAVVHNPVWMDFGESFPLMAEISRTVYNYYNPTAPVEAIRDGDGAEQCELLGNPLIEELMSSTYTGP